MTHPHPKGNFVPKAVLMKSGLKSINTAMQNYSRATVSVNTARPTNTAHQRTTVNCARPTSNVFKRAQSHVKRPFNKYTTNKNNNFNEKVNTVRGNVNTARPKAVVSNKGNEANAGNPQLELQEKGFIDSGCFRYMTGNKSYLSDYEEIDGGFVAFGGNSKGGKITGKGKFDGKADEGFFVGYSVNIVAGNQSNGNVDPPVSSNSKDSPNPGLKPSGEEEKKDESEVPSAQEQRVNHEKDANANNTNFINTVSSHVNAAGIEDNALEENVVYGCEDDQNMPELEEDIMFDKDKEVGTEADMNNSDTLIPVSPIPTTKIHKDHHVS
ncbi:hypothetical protein Tco_0634122 [Tanacetum coccineum]